MIKAEAVWGDPEANLTLLERLAKPLRDARVDVLITPEGFVDGYMVRLSDKCTRRKLLRRCVTGPDDPIIRRVARASKRLGCYLCIGASERGPGNLIRNAAYLLDRKGQHVGTFYKVVPGAYYEPGSDLPVFETDFGTVGIVICADRRWPEHMRCLRLKGAELILNPTWGWYGGGNTAIMQTRAYENGIPVCFTHPYQALVCGQDGGIAAVLESNVPSVLVHDLDLAANPQPLINDEKASSHPVQNRRPELYGIIAEPVSDTGDSGSVPGAPAGDRLA